MDMDIKLDSIVSSIISKFRDRAVMGKKKYGTDLDRTDLSILDWIQHAQEEHMDAILYLEKLKKEFANKNNIQSEIKVFKEDNKEKEE
jgi:hypothetical protein